MGNIQVISSMLKEFGVPAHLLGYDYLIKAVELCSADKTYIRSITGKLYPHIAQCFGTTPSRVERAIRHAITEAFLRINPDSIPKLFGQSLNPEKYKATNSEFIAVISERYSFVCAGGLTNGQP